MENGTKKLGFRVAAGFIVGITIIFAVLASGVQLPTVKAEKGTLVVLLTDAPVELKHLNITISNISVQNIDSEEETWVDIPFVDGVTEWYTDLLALQNVTEELSVTQIPESNYTKVRMTVTTANATYTDGTTTDLRVPPGHLDISCIQNRIRKNYTSTDRHASRLGSHQQKRQSETNIQSFSNGTTRIGGQKVGAINLSISSISP